MNIKLIDFDAEHYATNLSQNENFLKWESVGATHFLIIRTQFGSDIKLTDEHINVLSAMDSSYVFSVKEERLEGVSGNSYFVILPRSGINTYAVTVKPSAYAIFACEYKGEDFMIYNPTNACYYQCPVSATVEVSVKKAPIENKSIFTKIKTLAKPKKEQRYYNVSLPEMPNYVNDLLCYSYEGCDYKFPITSQMLNKTVLIPEFNGKQPYVESLDSNAYKIINPKEDD